MPRKDKTTYQEYMRLNRQGLTEINTSLNIGVRGFEPPTSASQTLRAKPTALHPVINQFKPAAVPRPCSPFPGVRRIPCLPAPESLLLSPQRDDQTDPAVSDNPAPV
jgi:hypothetical protein